MPHKRREWLERIKAVEREHSAARLAADHLLEAATKDPSVLGEELKLRHVKHMASRLDGTYLIRLFAEFETGLRLFWPTAKNGADPPSRAAHLLDGVTANRGIPATELAHAHAVREYRNSLVHERDEPVVPIPIATARSHLCKFFARLPPEW